MHEEHEERKDEGSIVRNNEKRERNRKLKLKMAIMETGHMAITAQPQNPTAQGLKKHTVL